MGTRADDKVVPLTSARGLPEDLRARLEEWERTARDLSGAIEAESKLHLQRVREGAAKFVATVERLIGDDRIPERAEVRDAIGTVLYVSATATQWGDIHAAVSALSQLIRPYLEPPPDGMPVATATSKPRP